MRRFLVLAAAALGACAQIAQGPSLAGYPGLEYQLQSYYSARALEENATCTWPRMLVSGYEVVEDTPARLVMNVRYHYIDESSRDFENDDFFGSRLRLGTGSCDGFATRTFVVAKSEGGTQAQPAQALSVRSMTGPQRQLPPNSALQ